MQLLGFRDKAGITLKASHEKVKNNKASLALPLPLSSNSLIPTEKVKTACIHSLIFQANGELVGRLSTD